MLNNLRGRVAAVAAACAFVTAGCTKVETTAEGHGGNSWTTPGRLVFAESQDAKTLNPMLSTSAAPLDISAFVFSYAVRYDDKANPVPDALREIPTVANGDVSRDGLTLRYKLRANIRFQDGVKLTCADLAFTWRAVMNDANNDISRDGYDRIKSIDCNDPLVAVVHLKSVYAPFLQNLWAANGNAPILPAHLLEKYNDAKGSFNTAPFQSMPIGSGPFQVVRWDRGQQVVMKAFDGFYLGKPKLREVVFKYIPDENTLIDQVRTHEIDMGVRLTLSTWPLLQGIPGTVVSAVPIYVYDHVDFNQCRPLFADIAVRRALSMALDRASMSRDVAHGLSDPSDTALSPKISWAWTPDTAHYDFDAARAGAMLDADGWKRGPDGIRVKNGQRLSFNISTQTESATGKAYETVVQSEWHAAGADVSVKNAPTAQFFDNTTAGILQGGHYDTAIFAWSGAADPDDDAIYSGKNPAPKGQNALCWNDPSVNAAMDDELTHVDRARRLRDFQTEQRQFASEVPSIVLGYRRQPQIYNSDLRGYTASPVITLFWNPWQYSI